MNKTWWKESVVYQIYPRSFMDSNGDGIGDIKGITSKLEYLQELGIDVIWLSPVYESPNDDNGYDISDYQKIMDEFGTMDEFDEMLAKAHQLGIKIVMDLVVNHTSDEHKWFVESRKSKDNPFRDYYIWKDGKDGREPNNWGSCFGGSAWQFDDTTGMYFLHLFSKKQPDLNWDNPKVRDEVFQMMNWWCEKGIDGFRMDVISMISKVQTFPDGETHGGLYGDFGPYSIHGPNVHYYLKEMNQKVLSHYDVMTVGETSGVTAEEALKYAGEDSGELNMVFTFEHVDLGAGKFGKWTDEKVKLTELKKVLSRWQVELEGKAWNSLYWDNHDQPRCVSRFGNDTEYREESAKMLATCLHMMKGTPYIYQGEEIGMTNVKFDDLADYKDIESINAFHELTGHNLVSEEDMHRFLKAKSRDNARTPMQWDESEYAGFTTGTPWIKVNPNYMTINAKEAQANPNSVFHYYKKLIALRKQYEVIVYGKYELLMPESEEMFTYTRTLGKEHLMVVCNFTDHEVTYQIPSQWKGKEKQVIIHNYDNLVEDEMVLKAYEAFAWYYVD